MKVSSRTLNSVEILTAKNEHLKFEIAPALGGRILSVFNKHLQKEFLWQNKHLELAVNLPGTEYDRNFWGGIDELLPNDIPEIIDAISYPDHGELWTCPLDHMVKDEKISVSGLLPLSRLFYRKTLQLDPLLPVVNLSYQIRNESNAIRHFLWKLHAALSIEPGDRLISSARKVRVVDPEYSRFSSLEEFRWPFIENIDASVIPPANNSMDFFFLYDLEDEPMQLISTKDNHVFSYSYDRQVFPFEWYFASYGGFLDHYTAILEPCTTMPLSVTEAKTTGRRSVLKPGEEIYTTVQIYAGKKIN